MCISDALHTRVQGRSCRQVCLLSMRLHVTDLVYYSVTVNSMRLVAAMTIIGMSYTFSIGFLSPRRAYTCSVSLGIHSRCEIFKIGKENRISNLRQKMPES